MDDDQAAIAVAEAIRSAGGIKPETPPTPEEMAELEERRERFRYYWRRQAEERRRVEEAERPELQRQAEAAERKRLADIRERARHETFEQARRIRANAEERQRNAAIAQHAAEWQNFKSQLAQAEAQQRRQAWFDNQARLLSELEQQINPTPQPDPSVVYVTEVVEAPVKRPELSAQERHTLRKQGRSW